MSTDDDIVIRPATAGELIDLRHAILRAGFPREAAMFPGDDDASTHHLAAVSGGEIVGCVTLQFSEWDGAPAWQLRGMAVAAKFQNRGVGGRLLDAAEHWVAENARSRVIWCNGRTPAVGFYIKHGWRVVSGEFEIPESGPHVKMLKRIEPHVR